jgi:UDP-2,3-diacylglucosamine pyrophosphatase LpxH
VNLHEQLLAMLSRAANVSLVSQLRDDRLHFPDEQTLNVFIPDLHLVTGRRQYRFGTNALETLIATVGGLRDLKRAAAPSQVMVYQLGDMLDLWREADGLDPNAEVAAAIEDAHARLFELLYDADLDTQFLLGNHDYDLYRFPNYDLWQRYVCLPSTVALHGDEFDWVERLPDGLQNLLVHRFSPMVNPARAQLEAMRPCNQAMRARTRQADRKPSGIGALCRPADAAGSARFNVQDAQSPPAMLKFLDSARAKCAEADLSSTTAVIGHTHHARIAVHEDGGSLFALVDCGAWIEDCVTDDDPTPRPNAQIAALGANEIRIYQLEAR